MYNIRCTWCLASIRSYFLLKLKIFVIGNGQSREGYALNQIKHHIIGCNAVHRDHTCDEYVAVDTRMVEEILRNQANHDKTIYTREDWIDKYIQRNKKVVALPPLPFTGLNKCDQPFHWNSGPYAVLVACNKRPTQINLLGFDLWSKTSFVNNIYKGTPNYAGAHDRRVTPDFWIYQLARLFNHFSQIEFVQHQLENWRIPDSWKKIENLTIAKL
jgi:hypothetical protein